MNLKELINEVESKYNKDRLLNFITSERIKGIKQTVEAVDKDMMLIDIDDDSIKDWQKLKKLLSVK